jgi:hypothetical protein
MNITLTPNVWYKLYEEVDFSIRKFVTFGVQGPNIDISIDLSQYNICIPDESLSGIFPGPSLTFYTFAGKIGNKEGVNYVYSDSVEGRIETVTYGYFTILKDGFEKQTELLDWDFNNDGRIDINDLSYVSNVTNWEEGVWYYEHPTSLSFIITEPVYEGLHACKHDSSPFPFGEGR